MAKQGGKSLIDAAEVGALLQMTRAGFLRRRDALEEREQFPVPMPHCRRPMLWRRDQVEAWLERVGMPREMAVPIPQGTNVLLFRQALKA